MSIVTKDPHAWFVAENEGGDKQTVFNNERFKHNYPFGFEVNFADQPTPQTNTVTLYNMGSEHRNFYQKGQRCYVAFNWGSDMKILAEGYITKIDVRQSDGVTDTQVITFTEGTDYKNVEARKLKVAKKKTVNTTKTVKQYVKGHYENKRIRYTTKEIDKKTGRTIIKGHYKTVQKYVKANTKNRRIKTRATKTLLVNKTYKAGTKLSALIKGIASQSGIKISKMDLAKDTAIKKAYTAKGKPLTLIQALVKQADSKLIYVRGKLEIVNPKNTKRTWYEIDDKDLIQPPSYNESDGGEEGTWEITIPLVPDITVNVGIKMKSRYLDGKFYVKAGQHSSDGENPQTQLSLASL